MTNREKLEQLQQISPEIVELAKEGLRSNMKREILARHRIQMAQMRADELKRKNEKNLEILGDPFEEDRRRQMEQAERRGLRFEDPNPPVRVF